MVKELDVIGFGALNYDRLYIVDEVPKAGDEIVIKRKEEDAGGSAANTIVGLARLGLKTGFIGIIGFDDEGRWVMNSFEKDKVDTRGVSITSESRTGLAIGFVNANGERTLSICPGANNSLEITDINLGYAQKAKFIHLSSFVGDKQFDQQVQLVTRLSQEDSEIKFSFTPGMIYVRKGLDQLNPILERSYILFFSENEIELLTGLEYKVACNALRKKGAKIVAVTLGVKGCYVSDENESMFIGVSRPPQRVVDTTGAGDAFAAGFLYGLIRNESLRQCAAYGNSLASESVMKYGARKGLAYSISNFKHYQVSLLELLEKEGSSKQ